MISKENIVNIVIAAGTLMPGGTLPYGPVVIAAVLGATLVAWEQPPHCSSLARKGRAGSLGANE